MSDTRYPEIDWERLRKYRLKKVVNIMAACDLEALIIADTTNVRYVADLKNMGAPELFSELTFVVVNSKGEISACSQVVFKDMQERLPWLKFVAKIPAWQRASVQQDIRSELVVGVLLEMGISKGRIGIDFLPFQVKDALQAKCGDYDLVSAARDLLIARMTKSADEIKLLEASASNNDIGMQAGLAAMQAGATEYEVTAATIQAMAKIGIEGLTHYPICRSGERTFSEYVPVGRRLRRGDSVFLDIGNYGIGGYASDSCRTGIVGEPSDSIRKCYDALYTAHMQGIDAVRPGVMASEIHNAINSSLRKSGYPESMYANGHGIGIGMVELPSIAGKDELQEDIELKEGMTICLEPVTFVDEGGVKLEDVVLVTANGCKILTQTPYWGR